MRMFANLKRNSIRWLALAGLLLALVIALPFTGTKDAQAGSFGIASGYGIKSLTATANSITMKMGYTSDGGDISERKCSHTPGFHEECNGYNFRIRENVDGASWSDWTKVGVSYNSSNRMRDYSHTFTGLDAETEYEVHMQIRGSHHGHHHTGESRKDTKFTQFALPDAPTGVSGESGAGQITMSWTAPTNTSYIGHWEYYRVKGNSIDTSNLEDSLWQKVPGDGSATRFTDQNLPDGLDHGTRYTYAIRAVNTVPPPGEDDDDAPDGGGAGAAAVQTAETLSESAAKSVRPERVGNRGGIADDASIHLVWSHPSNVGPKAIDSWQIRYRRGNGSWGDNWYDISSVTFDPGTSDPGASDTPTPLYNYTVSGLRNGHEYTFEIRARNNHAGKPSGFVRVTPILEKPGEPRNLRATGGDRSATLTWKPPTNTRTFDKWQVQPIKDIGFVFGSYPWYDIPADELSIATDGTHTYTVTGLTNGWSYFFYVRAMNSAGTGEKSFYDTAYIRLVSPSAPTNLVATPDDSYIWLSWTPPYSSEITSYDYQTSVAQTTGAGEPGPGPWSDWIHLVNDSNGQAVAMIVYATNGVDYYIRIRAVNSKGAGAPSEAATATPFLRAPGWVGPVSATGGDTTVFLSWTAPLTGEITRYEYAMKTDGDYGPWKTLTTDGTVEEATVTGLANGVWHTFKLRAVNSKGVGMESAGVTVTPSLAAPPAPTNLAAVKGTGSATLSWTAPNTGEITKYQYNVTHEDDTASPTWQDLTTDGTATSAAVSGLTKGGAYTFRIRAVNSGGDGDASDPATVTLDPVPNAPTNLHVAVGDQELAISWTASVANDCPVTGYEIDLMRVEQSDDGDTFHVVTGGRSIATSKAFGELAAGTRYQVTVTAWSEDCGVGSDTLQGIYTTNAADATDDPTVPAAKADPGAPTNVVISRYGDDVQVNWDAPASGDNMCAVAWYDLRFMREGGEWLNSIQSFRIQRFGDQYVAGGEYTAEVYAYSWECDQWSLKTQATQTLE